jgi:hypothetical protein
VVRRVALLVAALLLMAPAAAHAALETVLQDDGLLLHKPAAEVRSAVDQLRALGVDRVRLTANWSALTRDAGTPQRPVFDASDPAAYEQARWRSLDQAVTIARAAGLKVVLDIGFWAPVWATSDPSGPRARSNVDPQAFAAFAVAVARRYAGGFVPPVLPPGEAAPPPSPDQAILEQVLGKPPAEAPPAPAGEPLPSVDQIALWNEPNHPALLLPQWAPDGTPASPSVYRRMVAAAYPAVKAVRPDLTVLVGNTSSQGGRPGSGPVAPLAFLRGLACVDAALKPLATPECRDFQPVPGDGWGHHPYANNRAPDRRLGPDDAPIASVAKLADLLDRLVAAGRLAPGLHDIFLTEFGYETARVGDRPALSEAQQARYLTWAEALATRVPAVRSWPQFLLRDQPPAQAAVSDSASRPYGEWYTGLLRADGAPKLAAATFRMGLFAQRAGRRTLLFGRLRLGPQTVRAWIERRAGRGPWRRVGASFATGGADAFTRTAPVRRGAQYRLRVRGAPPGLAVPEVG